MDGFLRELPKIELHAHLNGSLRIASIRELGAQLYGDTTPEFQRMCEQFIEFDDCDLSNCFKKFKFMHELTTTERGLQLATMLVIRDMAEDNVVHLELRTTPKSNGDMSKGTYLECVLNAIMSATLKYNINVKLLPSIDRSQAPSEAIDTLELVLALRTKYPDIIVGLDFSGNPASGQFVEFAPTLAKARDNGLKLALHCAELRNVEEIAEMLVFGMKRCGHGTFLSDEQGLLLGRRNTAIECCLTSNVKCGSVRTVADHHFKQLLGAKIPVVLCTDDSGVFDTTLTQEFAIAAQVFDLKCKDFYILSMNAVEHAFASEREKALLRKKIKQYFDEKIID